MLQNIIEIIILSAIQGISEFLPVSSSAHLILISSLYEFKSSSLLIDVSLHLGSLIAIIYFFRYEIFDVKNNKRLLGLITEDTEDKIAILFDGTSSAGKSYTAKQLNARHFWEVDPTYEGWVVIDSDDFGGLNNDEEKRRGNSRFI